MTTDVMSHAALTTWPIMALVIFVAVFVVMTIWVVSRSKGEIDQWSKLPIDQEK